MARGPNVLWIIADQLRYHALGVNGDPNVTTPAMDRLAEQGVRCTDSYSNYPVCMPFRASLMTGQYAHVNGVMRHGDYLDPSARTVAHEFADAGYRTSYVGKWHLAPESGAAMVSQQGWAGQDFWVHPRLRGGFQDWYGFNISNNYLETYICSGEKVEPRRLEGYQTDALTDISIEYLSERAADGDDARPWFHVISYESPHPGWGGQPSEGLYPVPEKYRSLYDPAGLDLRPNVPPSHEPTARQQLSGYYRLIANLDDNIGRLLAHLDDLELAGTTLVVLLSDHGEMGGSHGMRNKQVPFEESLHVPLMLRWPGRLTAGSVCEGLFSGVDIGPTTMGLCGVPVPAAVQGLDQSRVLHDPAGAHPRDGVLVQWEDTRYGFGDHPYRALRTRRYTHVVARDDAFCLTFDHDVDPYELDNLYWRDDAAGLRRELDALLLEQLDRAGEAAPEYVLRRVSD
ncbi:MAG TPA: sulfatase [Trueperaceae bacterium]|nr:sulfatase [Trueperaceae bacterium]